MKHILPAGEEVSYQYLTFPEIVNISPGCRVVIHDSLDRVYSSDLVIKSYNDKWYFSWVTPDKSGSYKISILLGRNSIYTTAVYVLNESEASHPGSVMTIPNPLPPVFLRGSYLYPNSIFVEIKTQFGLPEDPYEIKYAFLKPDLSPYTPYLDPIRDGVGRYHVGGNLDIPGGENSVEWKWKSSIDSPYQSAYRDVSVLDYSKYSSNPGVSTGNVGYVCCSGCPCKCVPYS